MNVVLRRAAVGDAAAVAAVHAASLLASHRGLVPAPLAHLVLDPPEAARRTPGWRRCLLRSRVDTVVACVDGAGGLLSFPPGMDFFDLQSLNVLIGPNASGKSNFIEVLELLHAIPTDFAAAVRGGGGAAEWLWKGSDPRVPATMEMETGPDAVAMTLRPLKYRLSFDTIGPRVNIVDEAVEDIPQANDFSAIFSNPPQPYFYYTFHQGRPVINIRVRTPDGKQVERKLQWDDRSLDQSVLAQRKDRDLYPELFGLATMFKWIQTFREWTFGRYNQLRGPQRADLPERWLLSDCSNLALVLNQIEHRSGPEFDEHLKRFFPRFRRMTTEISGGTVQFYLHESDFPPPCPQPACPTARSGSLRCSRPCLPRARRG